MNGCAGWPGSILVAKTYFFGVGRIRVKTPPEHILNFNLLRRQDRKHISYNGTPILSPSMVLVEKRLRSEQV